MLNNVTQTTSLQYKTTLTINIKTHIQIIMISLLYLLIFFLLVNKIFLKDKSAGLNVDILITFLNIVEKFNNKKSDAQIKDPDITTDTKFNIWHIILISLCSILVKIIIIDKLYENIYKNIYNTSIESNVINISTKYNIVQKSFLASNALKSLLLNNIYLCVNRYILITQVLLFILTQCKDMESKIIYSILVYIILCIALYYNLYYQVQGQLMYINLIIIIIKLLDPPLININFIAYILYIFYNVIYQKHIPIGINLKKYGSNIPNGISAIQINNDYLYPFMQYSYTFNVNKKYILSINNGIAIDDIFYNLSNLFYHNKEYYIIDNDNISYQYKSITQEFWKDIIIIEEDFEINDISIYEYCKLTPESISTLSEMMKHYDFDIYKPIIWSNLSQDDRIIAMLLIILGCKSNILLIPNHIFDSLSTTQQNQLLELQMNNKICIIGTNNIINSNNKSVVLVNVENTLDGNRTHNL